MVFSWCSNFGGACDDAGPAESALGITPSLETRFPVKQLLISVNKRFFLSLLYFVLVVVPGV